MLDVARDPWPPHGPIGQFQEPRHSQMACVNCLQYIWHQQCGNDDSVSTCQKTIADKMETSKNGFKLSDISFS